MQTKPTFASRLSAAMSALALSLVLIGATVAVPARADPATAAHVGELA